MSELYEIFVEGKNTGGTFLNIWEKDGDLIRDVSSETYEYELQTNEDLLQGIIKSGRHVCLDKKFISEKLKPFSYDFNQIRGTYYPRIYKPIYCGFLNEQYILSSIDYDNRTKYEEYILENNYKDEYAGRLPINHSNLLRSLEQLSSLIEMLKKIFRTVYPSSKNEDSYGFDIRNLIILASTEFEVQIKGILKENNISSINNNYTTKDYVKLIDELKLSSYSVSFSYYPELQSIKPFEFWKVDQPTKSLFWYDSYNHIKHDRESSFEESTLKVLINSISACFIILLAQYGERKEINEITSGFWNIVEKPMWHTWREMYTIPFKGKWKIKQLEI